VVYHVQTEDKGLETPIILSLVYSRGEILASKRSKYEDLIAQGFNDEVLAERLKRQQQLKQERDGERQHDGDERRLRCHLPIRHERAGQIDET